jgi:hypothetical protein
VEIEPGFFGGRVPVAAFRANYTLHGMMVEHDPEKWKPVSVTQARGVLPGDRAQTKR